MTAGAHKEAARPALARSVSRCVQLLAETDPPAAAQTAQALARVIGRLRALADAPADPAHASLVVGSGLSPEMVTWALRETFSDPLARAVRAAAPAARPALGAVILASNVFLAGFQPIAALLLEGAVVLVKASSRDDAFPRLLAQLLAEVDAQVAERLEVVTLDAEEPTQFQALFARVDHVVAFGSDRTVAEIGQQIPAGTRADLHGHGFGVLWVPSGVEPDAADYDAMALDVAAYDQRGCLSPWAVIVEGGATDRGERVAKGLAGALEDLAPALPRGKLTQAAQAAELQWRGVARACGTLFPGRSHAVSFEGDTPVRPTPGQRNVCVLSSENRAHTLARLQTAGRHLSAVGVVGGMAEAGDLTAALQAAGMGDAHLEPPAAGLDASGPPKLTKPWPRICPAGQMQRPVS